MADIRKQTAMRKLSMHLLVIIFVFRTPKTEQLDY